jgi:hypothetical protein
MRFLLSPGGSVTRHSYVLALSSAFLWLGACCPTAIAVRAVAKPHKGGGLVLSGRLLSPSAPGERSVVQVDLTNCDRVARTIYWPPQKGNVTWSVTDSSDGSGPIEGGSCPKGIGDPRPVNERPSAVIEPGQHWSIVCPWASVTPDPRLQRFTVNANVETPDGTVNLSSTQLLDAEVVPTCDWSEAGDEVRTPAPAAPAP